jgi:hypothetical protein
MERRHHLAHRALVVTKPRSRVGWSTASRGGTSRAGVGQLRRDWGGATGARRGGLGRGRGQAGWSGARAGPGVARAAMQGAHGSGGARGSDAREREAGERNGGVGYYTCLCSLG